MSEPLLLHTFVCACLVKSEGGKCCAFADCWLLVSPAILHIHCHVDGCRGSRCKWFVLCCRAQGPARRIHSLAVHPAQPHLAASGASDGGLAIWDLRFDAGSPPQQAALDQSHVGAVLKVRFRVSSKRATTSLLLKVLASHLLWRPTHVVTGQGQLQRAASKVLAIVATNRRQDAFLA